MDDPSLDAGEHKRALKGLARTHQFTQTTRKFWKRIKQLFVESNQSVPLRLEVMDVGCGDGFLLFELVKLAQRDGVEVIATGCDFSQTAIRIATNAAAVAEVPFKSYLVDITTDPLPPVADVVINSLFLHHFETTQVVDILRKFDNASNFGVVIQDLKRSRLGYGWCWIGTRLLSRSHIVHADGLRSVAAAFSDNEIDQLLDQAGLSFARVDKIWPERFLISWTVNED